MKKYMGIIVDAISRRQFKGEITVENGKIIRVEEKEHDNEQYILPGLVDAHVHIESSMTVPSVFARMAVAKGTVAVVSDPHEIANVMGEEGIEFMLEDSKKSPLKVYFGVPSCVPATPFESSGAVLDINAVDRLLAKDDLHYLSEMMNFPGVILEFPDVMAKLESARKHGKVIDGHAPGLRGADLQKYIGAGISTDHECFEYEEAREKIELGMKILIREGSSARNFETLYPLIDEYPDHVMLCTDDSHPDTLIYEGHIDKLIRRGQEKGLDIYNLIRTAVFNPVEHYGLNVGLLREGDPADFIIVDNLKSFNILSTFIDGECVYENGKVLFPLEKVPAKNVFNRNKISIDDVKLVPPAGAIQEQTTEKGIKKIRVIVANDGELVTGQELIVPKIENGNLVSDPERDILKMVVLSRYSDDPVRIGFIKNIGLEKGAIASSIAHDSHNIIAVGATDEDIVETVNRLIKNKGGIAVGTAENLLDLPLEVAGLMSTLEGEEVASRYHLLNEEARKLGTSLESPFMTLAFMSLLVIPELKLGDKGLFDVTKFEFVDLFADE
ncbi:MAG: adenine deaminase [Methanosarcina mazei]|jgi:adenine deaminase|uniref:Adenine deaminase n=3 Tax=Methanosarcina mazei TaxID=2209 RepID=ADEC_METMA|nr:MULTISPECIES: adenine deaminase [Methanosarcina]Q8PT13.1 RecName: Full=Adenine deaminase; Short=Adenase; Short=Adenine aminase [Methanosarcina mazei Go1]MDY0247119.1 adenine deaminase [Methanosarcina mazei]AAM32606.1 Adenine deaminase [Methanosarcina mazei Go1]AGF98253.1 Adenine deaminase [Methanosarcina mazei Tuc01]AKB65001.1 Adenine deaminase [Methanosarcina mazei S-6]TAH63945.1 MAG: adenine deaminase [Methanosarcina mazei]